MKEILQKLHKTHPWNLLWISILLAELLTALSSYLFCTAVFGYFPEKIWLIGSFDSFIVSLIVVSIIIFFINKIKQFEFDNEKLRQEIEAGKQLAASLQQAHNELDTRVQQRTQELVQANNAKSLFLANMSHEIRTPLNGIIGMTEMLADTAMEGNQRDFFSTIQSEAKMLNNLINGILDVAKIETGKLELELTPFNLQYLFDDFAKSFSCQTRPKNILFTSTLSPDVPTKLIGDPCRLRQIFTNLTGNALKFTPNGGEISLSGERSHDVNEEMVMIRFTVHDSGIGIAKDQQQNIFERFSQADISTTRKFGGTGLGTTISKQLAELMGGEIGVESEPGRGSDFWFTAVFGKQKSPVPPKENKAFKNIDHLKILIVEHSESTKSFLVDSLSSFGCRIECIPGGAEALIQLKNTPACEQYDLIFIAIMMQGMNGFDLARQIKTLPDYTEVPLILTTSAGERGEGSKCKEIGVSAYLSLPLSRSDILNTVIAVLDQKHSDQDPSRTPQLITKHSLFEKIGENFTLLLVEDYPTNQKVALAYLTNAGYHADVAENGQKAVEAYQNKKYDLILMDIQMPEMDGYQATAAIRALEKGSELLPPLHAKTPIIALTAHATEDDKRKCLEAGMDDFLTKPLQRGELLQTLNKWLVAAEITLPQHSRLPQMSTQEPPPVDFEKAIKEFDGQRDLVFTIIQEFSDDIKNQVQVMNSALAAGDFETLRKEAHSIKGGAANIHAAPLSQVAKKIEELAKEGDMEKIGKIIQTLVAENEKMRAALDKASA